MDVAKVKSQMHSLAIGQAMGKAAEDYKKVGGARNWARETLQRVYNPGRSRQAAPVTCRRSTPAACVLTLAGTVGCTSRRRSRALICPC